MTDEGPTLAGLVARLTAWLDRLMPTGARQAALVAALTARFGADPSPVTAEGVAAVEGEARRHSRHLALHHEPSGTLPPHTESRGWPPLDPAVVRARAAHVTMVERRSGGACVIRLTDLDPVDLAEPYVEAAFALAEGASRIVLDLRDNGGGDPGTVALICGRLLGVTELSTVVYRDREHRWTTPAGRWLRQPLDVLVSPRTFSSGEALAYHLQSRGRAMVHGETTPGAADHITPIRLLPTVRAELPEAYVIDTVTGTNWEGVGVVPDLPCPETEALNRALEAGR
ncbi:S41 family peptidase [Dactylosporangium sp. NPDC005572]|uniref:S41 family peptidase n=1 Tax=Dactylosporangium sp. NPDC005572 TaxID=3156889 RepID=UPI0033B17109